MHVWLHTFQLNRDFIWRLVTLLRLHFFLQNVKNISLFEKQLLSRIIKWHTKKKDLENINTESYFTDPVQTEQFRQAIAD